MNVQDREALHTYQRLACLAFGESGADQQRTTSTNHNARAAGVAGGAKDASCADGDASSEATKACIRLLGLLELEANRASGADEGVAAATAGAEAARRLKREVRGKMLQAGSSHAHGAGPRDEEDRRTKLFSCSAFDVERREGNLPGAERPLFHCPPSGTLSLDTLLASVRTPWLHAVLAAPPSSTTSTSTSTSSTASSSSSSLHPHATPAASSLRGKPYSSASSSSSSSASNHTNNSGGSAPSLARSSDRPAGRQPSGPSAAGGVRRINYGRNRYNNRQADSNNSPDDDHLIDMDEDDKEENKPKKEAFINARQLLDKDDKQKGLGGRGGSSSSNGGSNAQPSARPSGLRGKRGFNPPFKGKDDKDDGRNQAKKPRRGGDDDDEERKPNTENNPLLEELLSNEKLKFIDPIMVERICSEILDHSPAVGWDDIAGLAFAKKCVKEAVVLPLLRPDFFRGIRTPPKGILLFGPPGTGKTMIGKAIASQSGARFFAISASSLTSKWIGEGEKTVRALFAVARCLQPAVIFIDEIDSILTQRSENDQEATRRLKTEFLIQLDGAACSGEDKLLVVGATNRPAEIDEAARRRLVKRLYIPLPDALARKSMIIHYMQSLQTGLTDEQVDTVVTRAQGYSGSDIKALCAEAAMGPIRNLEPELLMNLSEDQIRPIGFDDFVSAFDHVRPSVSQKDLASLQEWNEQYGSFKTTGEESLLSSTAPVPAEIDL